MSLEDLPNYRTDIRDRLRAEDFTPARIETIARGLGRSQMVGRYPNGLPVTERAYELNELMRRNEAVRRSAAEGGLDG